jgi:transposase
VNTPAATPENEVGMGEAMSVYCGIDRATGHHDVAVIDDDGKLLAKARIDDDSAGFGALLALLAEHDDNQEHPIPVAIETSRGLLVACLRATGRAVYAINPMAAARYRERTAPSRKKSDHLDAKALAGILRTDQDRHRPLPADTDLAQAVGILARAQQDAVWDRTQAGHRLRAYPREYYPGFLAAFGSSDRFATASARTILAATPTPALAAQLTHGDLRALLQQAGRKRSIDAEAARIHTVFQRDQLRMPPLVEHAMGEKGKALLRQFEAACTSAEELEAATTAAFDRHPDQEVYLSFPGLGPLLAARVMAEIGDDHSRFADARGLKAYAGAAPVTRASGKTTSVRARKVKNDRLASVGYMWSLCAINPSRGARAHYDARRNKGDWNTTALRNLNNKVLGSLHHCLGTSTTYNEATAFPGSITADLQDRRLTA